MDKKVCYTEVQIKIIIFKPMKKEMFFAPGYDGELNFSLDFFARLLLTNEENLSFGIIERKFSTESTLKHPAVLVKGCRDCAFDIEEVQFVHLGSFCRDMIKFFPAEISFENEKIIFTGTKKSFVYTRREFLGRYKTRVVNKLLL